MFTERKLLAKCYTILHHLHLELVSLGKFTSIAGITSLLSWNYLLIMNFNVKHHNMKSKLLLRICQKVFLISLLWVGILFCTCKYAMRNHSQSIDVASTSPLPGYTRGIEATSSESTKGYNCQHGSWKKISKLVFPKIIYKEPRKHSYIGPT